MKRFLGVFVNPFFVQYEGLDSVFDNLERVGASAISTTPRVGQPAAEGARFPDLHMDGHERLLGRALWGQYELPLNKYPAFPSNPALYKDLPYQPKPHERIDGIDYDIPAKMLAEARRRGWEAHLQFHPLMAPNIRPEDQPVYIDGSAPAPPQIAMPGCPNNPNIQAYGLALLEDTLRNVDALDGVFIDWTEFGAYRLEDHFTCFCPHCQARAESMGFDWTRIEKHVWTLWEALHNLSSDQLAAARDLATNPGRLLELLTHYPGWLDLLRLKAATVTAFYQSVRDKLNSLGFRQAKLSARGWPPPWNRSSGMDYRSLAKICDAVTPKLFLFDYAAVPRWYGQTLLNWNPTLAEGAILDTVVALLNLPDDIQRRSFAQYHIPGPDEAHHVDLAAYRERVDEVRRQVNGRAQVYPYLHAYLPEAQWKRMLALMRDSGVDGAWVQMYGYLTDRKLDILRDVWR